MCLRSLEGGNNFTGQGMRKLNILIIFTIQSTSVTTATRSQRVGCSTPIFSPPKEHLDRSR